MEKNRVQISIGINSTALSALFIRPKGDSRLIAWSFSDEIPETFNQTYFVSVAIGVDEEPFKIDLTFDTRASRDEPILDLTLISMIFDEQKSYTKEFNNLLKRFPDWSFAVSCIAAVTSYVL